MSKIAEDAKVFRTQKTDSLPQFKSTVAGSAVSGQNTNTIKSTGSISKDAELFRQMGQSAKNTKKSNAIPSLFEKDVAQLSADEQSQYRVAQAAIKKSADKKAQETKIEQAKQWQEENQNLWQAYKAHKQNTQAAEYNAERDYAAVNDSAWDSLTSAQKVEAERMGKDIDSYGLGMAGYAVKKTISGMGKKTAAAIPLTAEAAGHMADDEAVNRANREYVADTDELAKLNEAIDLRVAMLGDSLQYDAEGKANDTALQEMYDRQKELSGTAKFSQGAWQNAYNELVAGQGAGSADAVALAKKLKSDKGEIGREKVATPLDKESAAYKLFDSGRQDMEKAQTGFSQGGKFAYGVGTSVLQNAAMLPMEAVAPGSSLFMMGAISTADTIAEQTDKGRSAAEALGRGLATGLIEAGTEKIGLDNLTDIVKGSSKSAVKRTIEKGLEKAAGAKGGELVANLLSEMSSEGLEEVAGYLANYAVDKVAADPDAQFDWGELLQSGLAGTLAGGVLGAGGTVVNRVQSRVNEKQYANAMDAIEQLPGADIDQQNEPVQSAAPEPKQVEIPVLEGVKQASAESQFRNFSVTAKIRANIQTLQSMEPVAKLSGQEFPKSKEGLVTQVGEFFKSLGNKVNRQGFGEVKLLESGARSSMAHGIGRAKAIAFAAVPDVIKNGKQIDAQENWKGRGYDTVVFAAPIEIGGEASYMGVVVRKNPTDSNYYLHEVVDENGNIIFIKKEDASASFKTGIGTNADTSEADASYKNSISQTKENTSRNAEYDPSGFSFWQGEKSSYAPKKNIENLIFEEQQAERQKSQTKTETQNGLPMLTDSKRWAQQAREKAAKAKDHRNGGPVDNVPQKYEYGLDNEAWPLESSYAEAKRTYENWGPKKIPNTEAQNSTEYTNAEKNKPIKERAKDTAKNKFVRQLAKDWGIPYARAKEVIEPLAEKVAMQLQHDGKMNVEIADKLFEETLANGIITNDDFYNQYKNLKNELKSQAITVNKADVDSKSFEEFRKKNFGTLRIVKESGTAVDVFYDELNVSWPGLFPSDITHPADQLARMSEVAKSIKKSQEIVQQFAEHNEGYAEVARMQFDDAVEKLIQRIGQAQEVATEKADYKQRAIRERESRRATELRGQVKNIKKDLDARLKNPTETHYIPKDLVQAAIKVCDTLDFDTGRTGKNEGPSSWQMELAEMSKLYKKLRKDPDYLVSSEYSEEVAEALDTMDERFQGKSIYKMSVAELEDVKTVMQVIRHSIQSAGRLIGDGKRAEVKEAAGQAINEVESSKGYKAESRLQKAMNSYENTMLSAKRMFRRMGGYTEGGQMEQFADMLNRGQRKQLKIQMEGARMFDELTAGKDNAAKMRNFSGRGAELVDVGLKTKNGKSAKITKAQLASLYMHLQNEQNINHIMRGGLRVPNEALYARGDIADAYTHGEIVSANLDQLQEIAQIAQDDKYVQAWCKVADKFFNQFTKNYINDTTMRLYGFKKATVDKYFPIKTDTAFTARDFESIKRDASMEGMGMLKNRQIGAANPIMLEDINNVVARQLDNTAKFSGLAIPIRNMNKILNWSNADAKVSLKESIGQKYGDSGKGYIENLMADLQGARNTPQKGFGKVLGNLQGNFAAATLMLNPSVTIKQAASYPTAAAKLGWKPVMQALAKGGKDGKVISRADRAEIDKWTGALWYRNQGNSTQELGDFMKNEGAIPQLMKRAPILFNTIQKADSATVGRLWYASKYYVEANFKELTPGSNEYFMKVADVFNDVVEDTQPNYTVMQRSDLLRNPNALVKAISMFKTQSFQNYGILYDAYENYQAQAARGKDSAATKKAKTELVNSISSIVVSQAVFALMGMVGSMAYHGMDDYRDDKGELTAASITAALVKTFGSSMAGMAAGGSELYNLAMAATGNGTWYGVDAPALESINNFAGDLTKLAQAAAAGKSIEAPAWKVAKDISVGMGIPLKNAEKIVKGMYSHGEDIANGQFGTFDSDIPRLYNTATQEAIAGGKGLGIKQKDVIDLAYNFKQITKAAGADNMLPYLPDTVQAYTKENNLTVDTQTEAKRLTILAFDGLTAKQKSYLAGELIDTGESTASADRDYSSLESYLFTGLSDGRQERYDYTLPKLDYAIACRAMSEIQSEYSKERKSQGASTGKDVMASQVEHNCIYMLVQEGYSYQKAQKIYKMWKG